MKLSNSLGLVIALGLALFGFACDESYSPTEVRLQQFPEPDLCRDYAPNPDHCPQPPEPEGP